MIFLLKMYLLRYRGRGREFESLLANMDEEATDHVRTMFYETCCGEDRLLDRQRLVVIMTSTLAMKDNEDEDEASPSLKAMRWQVM